MSVSSSSSAAAAQTDLPIPASPRTSELVRLCPLLYSFDPYPCYSLSAAELPSPVIFLRIGQFLLAVGVVNLRPYCAYPYDPLVVATQVLTLNLGERHSFVKSAGAVELVTKSLAIFSVHAATSAPGHLHVGPVPLCRPRHRLVSVHAATSRSDPNRLAQ